MFEYRSIEQQDVDRILKDASRDKEVLETLNYVLAEDKFTDGWSVNEDRADYLFNVQKFVRSTAITFYLCFEGQFYRIECPLFTDTASFVGFPKSSEHRRSEIQELASEAIAVNKYHVCVNEPKDIFNISIAERNRRRPEFVDDDIDIDM